MPRSASRSPVSSSTDYEERSAEVSPCGTFRYLLNRRWRPGNRNLVFIMLNPSTADAVLDDPTIRRCRRIAKSAGYYALSVVNLFAYRATDPRELIRQGDLSPVGSGNDEWIRRITHQGTPTVAVAWGCYGARYRERAHFVVGLVQRPVFCLGVTKTGQPRHPLLVPASQALVPWEAPERAKQGKF
jgi:hypothetical protein